MKQMHRQWCRLVFSKSLGRMIAFGEVVSSDGGASGGFLRLSLRASSLTSCLIGALAATPALTTPAWANPVLPEKGQIVSGGGTIGINDRDMTIRQDDKKLIINWDKFNIGKDDRVTFNQPDATSIALNRVLGTEGSNIAGALSANGQVFLLNPNGVVFANGAQVNVAGLLASTLSMSDEDFNNGNNGVYRLTSDPKGNGKAVTNNGSLTGGYIALVGDKVGNSGTIATPGGRAALAGGETVTLGIDGSSLVSVTVDAQAARQVLLENSGTIRADNGTIQLTARGNNVLTDLAINNTGTLEATGLSAGKGGQIVLEGDNGQIMLEGRRGSTVKADDAELKISTSTTGRVDIWGKGADQSTLAAKKLDISGGQVNINNITVTSDDRGSIRAEAPSGQNAFHVSGVRLKKLDITATSDRRAVSLSTNVTLEDVTIKGTTTGGGQHNSVGVYTDGTVTSDDKTTITGIATGTQDNRGVLFLGGRIVGGTWRAEADNGIQAAEFAKNVTTENVTLHAENKGTGKGIAFAGSTNTNGHFTGISARGTGIEMGWNANTFKGDSLTLNGRGAGRGIFLNKPVTVDLSDQGTMTVTGVGTTSGFDLSNMNFVKAVRNLKFSSEGSARGAVNYMPSGPYNPDALKEMMGKGIDNMTYFNSYVQSLVDMLKESLAKAGNGDWNLDFSNGKSGGWSFDMAKTVFNVKGNADIRGLMFNNATLNVDKNLTLGFAGQGVTGLKNTQVTVKGDLNVQGDKVLLHGRDKDNRSGISAGNVTLKGQSIEIRDVNLEATQGDLTITAESTTKDIPVQVERSTLKAKNDLKITALSKTGPDIKWGLWSPYDKGALTVSNSHLEAGRFMELTGKTENGSGQYGIGGIMLNTVTFKALKGKFTGETNSGYHAYADRAPAGIALYGQMAFEGLFDLDARTRGGAAAFFMTNAAISLIDGAKVDVWATGEASDLRKNLGTVTIVGKNSVEGNGEFNINATANTGEATVYFYAGSLEGDGKAKVTINAKNTGSGDGILIHQGEANRPTGVSNVTLSGEAITGDGIRFEGDRPLTAKDSTIKGTSQSGKGISASGAKDVSLENSTVTGTSENNTGVDFNGKANGSTINGTSGSGVGVNIGKDTVLDGHTTVIGTGQIGKGVALPPGFSTGEDTVIISRTSGIRIVPGNPVVPPDLLPPSPPSGGDTGTLKPGILIPDTNVKQKYQTPDVVFRLVDRKINPDPAYEVCSEDGSCGLETISSVFSR